MKKGIWKILIIFLVLEILPKLHFKDSILLNITSKCSLLFYLKTFCRASIEDLKTQLHVERTEERRKLTADNVSSSYGKII